MKLKICRDWKEWIVTKATLLDPRIKNTLFIRYYCSNQCLIKSSYKMICNFSDDQAGIVVKPTKNFESELEMYLKEPASMYIIK